MVLMRSTMACVLCALMAGATAAAPAQPPVPLLWRIQGDAGSVFLLGSVHLLKESDYPLHASVDAAFAEAEELVFEISPEEMRSGAASAQMMRLGAYPAGESLRDHVSADTWAAVQAYVDGGGYLPLSAIERMRPWFLGLTLALMEMQRAGLNPAFGIEQHFMRLLDKEDRQSAGLETVEQQLTMLSEGSASEQEQQLRQALEQLPEMAVQLERMHALWRSGDGEGLHALMQDEMGDYPALYERLIVGRNRTWIPQIEAQLADEGDELVIVGAAHLVGDDGVVALLRDRGHTVERLR